MSSLDCPRCKKPLTVQEVLRHGTFSWSELSAFWFVCPHCDGGSHFRATDYELSRIRILGAPGPDWEIIDTLPVAGLTVRADPGFLHVWFNQTHFEFPARVA